MDTAVEAMRAGRGTGFEDVIAMGDAAIPSVTRYLKDRDEGMRSQAVSVLAVIGTQAAWAAGRIAGESRQHGALSLPALPKA